MIRISPYSRLSLGLVFLTISLIIGASLLRLIPNEEELIISERQVISEALAIFASRSAEQNDFDTIEYTIQLMLERNESILSAALRKSDNSVPVIAGNHNEYWKKAHPHKSTLTHVRVPIYQGKQHLWGTLEVVFKPVYGYGILNYLLNPLILLTGFFALSGFIIYRFFLKRVLKHMDPTSVVPPRVKMALNTLIEGVVLLDTQNRIILANDTFRQKIAKTNSKLMGRDINSFNWAPYDPLSQILSFPWNETLTTRKHQIGIPLCMPDETQGRRIFMVNTSPIIDNSDNIRGVLVTFDDVTQIEEKNEQLKAVINKLELYSEKIKHQNQKLQYLATRDPLTGCRNRRSFFEIFSKELTSANRYGHKISCIMFDIDHFKNINDTHGHAAGDMVLKGFAQIIGSHIREMDTMGRYGGEEFCIILPHIDISKARQAAERFRSAVQAETFSGISVTASFGVSAIGFGANSPEDLVDQADQALYAAKEGGRNRVVTWTDIKGEQVVSKPDKQDPAQSPPLPSPSVQASLVLDDADKTPSEHDTQNRNGDEDKLVQEALLFVKDGLSSNGVTSETDKKKVIVQVNATSKWGNAEPEKQEPLNKLSTAAVVRLLQKNKRSKR